MKTCTKCLLPFPATREFFYWKVKKLQTLETRCITCYLALHKTYKPPNQERKRERERAWRLAHPERYNARSKAWRLANQDRTKETTKAWRSANPDKIKEASVAHYLANQDRIKKATSVYRLANPDKIKEISKAYRLNNPDKVKETAAAYRLANPEKGRALSKAWQKANPDKRIAAYHKRQALKRGNEHSPYTTQQVLETYGTNCHICGTPIDLSAPRKTGVPGWERGLHLEHVIPISLGGPDNIGNVKPSHGKCNLHKHARVA